MSQQQQQKQQQRQHQQHLNWQGISGNRAEAGAVAVSKAWLCARGRGEGAVRGCYSYRSKIKLVISFSRIATEPDSRSGFQLRLWACMLSALAMAFCFDFGLRLLCSPQCIASSFTPPLILLLPLPSLADQLRTTRGIIAFASTMHGAEHIGEGGGETA